MVILVGHQPTLGQLAARLLAGESSDWNIKKGALWWFSSRVRHGNVETLLKAVISPDLL
jgi:phosphohistidine phosphatase